MRIAMCDDDKTQLDRLEEFVRQFARTKNLEIEIDCFTDGERLLEKNAGQHAYDLIFMDIYLTEDENGPEGIDIIRRLNLSRQQQVIFITTSREHAVEAYGLNATHYLVKPLRQEQITEAMERCMERSGKGLFHTLDVKTKQGTVQIPVENIIYIEVFNKVSHIQTSRNSIQTYASLDSLLELLDGSMFMRPQRSFIVNMSCIREFSFDHLVLTNGKSITLSRGNRAELKEQYQKFLFDMARRGEI